MALSTRELVRTQVQKAIESQDDCLKHLCIAEQLCEGRSTPMNEQLPSIVVLIENMKVILAKFRAEL
jgi:hypothetical protein